MISAEWCEVELGLTFAGVVSSYLGNVLLYAYLIFKIDFNLRRQIRPDLDG